MNELRTPSPRQAAVAATRTPLVDCDIHPRLRSPADYKPYLAERWWDHMQVYGRRVRHGFVKGHPYPKAHPVDGMRRDSFPPGGAMPGSDLDFMRAQYLDPAGVTHGVMNLLSPNGAGESNLDFAAALASAANDWQLEHFAHREPRLHASVCVPYEDPEASVREIQRRADDPHFCQVLLLSRTAEALGRRRYWPIYAAAQEAGLPIGIHVFGYAGYAATSSGWPSFYIEEMAEHGTSCSALLTSFVMEGVFERFPRLKLVLIEAGFAWLPALAWRLDAAWARNRAELPHVTRPPSEILRDHVWITTQPMEEPDPPSQRHLLDSIGWIGRDRIMFASDYPHWDFDDPDRVFPQAVDAETRAMIRAGNARAVYRFARDL
jgi:predicted TIM-barrel fold metal-dependent hydrolase